MATSFRFIIILIELVILAGLIYSLFSGLRFTLIDYRLNPKYKPFIQRVLIILGCLSLVFFIAHLISFYPKFINPSLFKVSSRNQFWLQQQIYINKIFSPIIIGFFMIFIGLLVLFIICFKKRHLRLWQLGQKEDLSGQIKKRLKTLLSSVFLNLRIMDEIYPGSMHFLIFWGTMLIFLGKIIRIFSLISGLTNPPQSIFLFASFISEFGGVLVIIGGLMAIFRRYILKPSRLDNKPERALIFIWGFLIIITGYFIKGYRIAINGAGIPSDWFLWAPISYPVSKIFLILSTQPLNELLLWHRVFIHLIPAVILFIYVIISHSPLTHLFLSPINIYFRSLKKKGVLNPIPDIEESEMFGVRQIFEFSWKQLMELEACTECGRCQDVCPAFLSRKPLSPKKMIQNLKEDFWRHSPQIFSKQNSKMEIEPIIGSSVTEEELWSCTTCMACEEVCPVYIGQLQKNIDLRRYLVLMETKFPSGLRMIFKNLMNNSNPWGMSRGLRGDWSKGLDISNVSDQDKILFWVGCAGSFDDRNIRVTVSIAKILKSAGIPFYILGNEEACCGDPARRTGNEYLFQTLATTNIELFKKYEVNQIVTICPHCFHTLKNEYPQFGGNFTVVHYSQYFFDLISKGVLKLKKPIQKTITYHDSCYLGRANNIYDPPRKILKSIPDLKVVEMEKRRNRSFCCGAGGGRMWLEENMGLRINQMRTLQAYETKAQLIGTACPYCLTMLSDGVKEIGKEDILSVYDLSELIDMALFD